MPANASPSQTADSTSQVSAPQARASAAPTTDSKPIVRRRRSEHRPRRSNARSHANGLSTQDQERKLKRKLELKILLIAVPTFLLIVGGILWTTSNANPDESMRPEGLIRLSYYMLGIGLTIGTAALFTDWAQKLLKIRKEKKENNKKKTQRGTVERKRSSHRRHRSR